MGYDGGNGPRSGGGAVWRGEAIRWRCSAGKGQRKTNLLPNPILCSRAGVNDVQLPSPHREGCTIKVSARAVWMQALEINSG